MKREKPLATLALTGTSSIIRIFGEPHIVKTMRHGSSGIYDLALAAQRAVRIRRPAVAEHESQADQPVPHQLSRLRCRVR